MKEVEGIAEFTAELDDFESEKREVAKNQGSGFPFSKGFWLLCQLVAAINPHDLDKIDETTPFTKLTMNDLLGRRLTDQEYQYYFNHFMPNQKYRNLYSQFAREDVLAYQILNNTASQQAYSTSQSPYPQANQGYLTTPQFAPNNPFVQSNPPGYQQQSGLQTHSMWSNQANPPGYQSSNPFAPSAPPPSPGYRR